MKFYINGALYKEGGQFTFNCSKGDISLMGEVTLTGSNYKEVLGELKGLRVVREFAVLKDSFEDALLYFKQMSGIDMGSILDTFKGMQCIQYELAKSVICAYINGVRFGEPDDEDMVYIISNVDYSIMKVPFGKLQTDFVPFYDTKMDAIRARDMLIHYMESTDIDIPEDTKK